VVALGISRMRLHRHAGLRRTRNGEESPLPGGENCISARTAKAASLLRKTRITQCKNGSRLVSIILASACWISSPSIAQQPTKTSVVAWGRNVQGQPVLPGGPSDVVDIAAGYYHLLAIKRDGTVVAWGDNTYGQVTVPSGLDHVVAVAGGL